jgi:uncharacterized tellurite resistance protein B-like protein
MKDTALRHAVSRCGIPGRDEAERERLGAAWTLASAAMPRCGKALSAPLRRGGYNGAMGWREWLGLDGAAARPSASATISQIAAELESLPADRALFVAGLAYLLGRVAWADHAFSERESGAMVELVARVGRLGRDQAALAVEIAKTQNRLFGGTENFLVTRELREATGVEERRAVLDCLFAVSAADEEITGAEEAQVRQIASELGLSHADFVAARSEWSRHRSVWKGLDRP